MVGAKVARKGGGEGEPALRTIRARVPSPPGSAYCTLRKALVKAPHPLRHGRPRGAGRALVLAGAALLLSACGSLHPGEAAVVGDATISDTQLEESTAAFCSVIRAINKDQNRPTEDIPVRTAALSALNLLVIGEGAEQLAVEEGITLTDDEVRRWIEQLPPVFDELPESEAEGVNETLELIAHNSLLISKLGRQGGTGVDPAAASERGTKRVLAYLEQIDAETDPRYGEAIDTSQAPGTGSLSVAISPDALRSADVPAQGTVSLTEAETCA